MARGHRRTGARRWGVLEVLVLGLLASCLVVTVVPILGGGPGAFAWLGLSCLRGGECVGIPGRFNLGRPPAELHGGVAYLIGALYLVLSGLFAWIAVSGLWDLWRGGWPGPDQAPRPRGERLGLAVAAVAYAALSAAVVDALVWWLTGSPLQ